MLRTDGTFRSRSRGGSGGTSSMAAAVSSSVFDLDPTQAQSYGGTGQSWLNLVAAPADGAAQSAYNFNLGASSSPSTDDPVFTGAVGSPSSYFLLDSLDYFSKGDGTNTAFLNAIQKTTGGTDFWFAVPFRFKNSGAIQALFGTNSATTQVGFRVTISATNQIQMQVRGDTANVTTNAASFSALVDDTDYLYIVSMSGTTVRQWLNSPFAVEAAFTKNACVTDGTASLKVAAQGAGSSALANGSRIYGISAGNGFLQDTDAVRIAQTYYGRQGRPYGFFP